MHTHMFTHAKREREGKSKKWNFVCNIKREKGEKGLENRDMEPFPGGQWVVETRFCSSLKQIAYDCSRPTCLNLGLI